jgi:tetratricopeptide (TPR) repeat protein
VHDPDLIGAGDGEVAPVSRHSNQIDGLVLGSTVVQVGQLNVHLPPQSAQHLPVPRQLPPAPRRFVNRQREIRGLDAAMKDVAVGSAPVVVLSGMRGVGKTATSRHWAHARSERFVDGQLHADFGELRHRGGVAVGDVLGSFLRALGLSQEDIPIELAERTALFRSCTSGKRVLLLLDDVEHAAQVRPLIPSADTSMVVMTTRAPMDELVFSEGACVIRLAPLDRESAQSILEQMVGGERIESEPDALVELVEICDGLPVALRVCGARLAGHEHRPLSWLVRELADESRRLERISVGSGQSIDVVFTEAYRALSPAAGELYCLLGGHPGTSFTAPVAAAAAGVCVPDIGETVDELCDANLIEDAGERLRFHDLLRIHARAAADRDLSDAQRDEALCRIVAYYVESAQRMDRALIPSRLRLAPAPGEPQEGAPALSSPPEAIAWFEDERPNILAVLRAASDREWDVPAWHLGEALWLAYHNRKHFGEALEVYTLAAGSAQRCGDVAAEARLRLQLARAYMDLEDLQGGARELDAARRLAERAGHRALEGSVIEFTGVLEINRGRYREAIAELETSRRIYRELENPRGIAIQEYHLGRALDLAGQHEQAVSCFLRAAELIDSAHDGLTLGRVLLHLGDAHRALGDRASATGALEQACEIMRLHDAPFYEAMARERLASLFEEAGDDAGASASWQQALAIYDALGSPRAADVKVRLAASPGAST